MSAPGDVFPYVDFEHPAFILCQLFVGSPPAVDLCVRVRCRYLSIYTRSPRLIIPSTTLLVPIFSRQPQRSLDASRVVNVGAFALARKRERRLSTTITLIVAIKVPPVRFVMLRALVLRWRRSSHMRVHHAMRALSNALNRVFHAKTAK